MKQVMNVGLRVLQTLRRFKHEGAHEEHSLPSTLANDPTAQLDELKERYSAG